MFRATPCFRPSRLPSALKYADGRRPSRGFWQEIAICVRFRRSKPVVLELPSLRTTMNTFEPSEVTVTLPFSAGNLTSEDPLELLRQAEEVREGRKPALPEVRLDRQQSRRFFRRHGARFLKWYQEVRMRLAAELLTDSKELPSVIAQKVGYRSYASFRIHFLVRYGVSPSVFRQNPSVRRASTPAEAILRAAS